MRGIKTFLKRTNLGQDKISCLKMKLHELLYGFLHEIITS